jgi:hypothetical protein
MQALPEPSRGGSVSQLRDILNLTDANFTLAVAWLLMALRGTGPYPVLVVTGEQGSAKSTVTGIIRRTIDPSTVLLRALPREDRDLFITASNAHVAAFDNLSGLPPWTSDSLCRLATGGGFSTRELYTNDDEVLFNVTRPIILNGITDVVTRPDLADRSVMLSLTPISDDRRRTENEIWCDFRAAHPAVLGALLDAVVHGLRELPKTKLKHKPRMADFALWVTACEGALCLPCTFDEAYSKNRSDAIETVIDADPVADAVRTLMRKHPEWIGTATRLLKVLGDIAGDAVRYNRHWPHASHVLSNHLRRAATVLRQVGIEIEFGRREGRASAKVIRIRTVTHQIQMPLS